MHPHIIHFFFLDVQEGAVIAFETSSTKEEEADTFGSRNVSWNTTYFVEVVV